MVNVKHFMDSAEPEDGLRLWVEPLGLTKDLCSLCFVHNVLSHIGPPRGLWEWFENNPLGYEYFRGRYHEYLDESGLRPALQILANCAVRDNITLLHQSADPLQNTAMALYEYLTELSAYCPPDV